MFASHMFVLRSIWDTEVCYISLFWHVHVMYYILDCVSVLYQRASLDYTSGHKTEILTFELTY